MTAPEREMLRNDILAAVVGEDFASNAEELEDAQRIADHLLSLGWCRRDAVLREAARVATDAAREAHEMLEDARSINQTSAMAAYNWTERRLDDCATAILSLLTPQARKEGA